MVSVTLHWINQQWGHHLFYLHTRTIHNMIYTISRRTQDFKCKDCNVNKIVMLSSLGKHHLQPLRVPQL